jgi:hypothetical protein
MSIQWIERNARQEMAVVLCDCCHASTEEFAYLAPTGDATTRYSMALTARRELAKVLKSSGFVSRKHSKHLCKTCLALVTVPKQALLFDLGQPNREKRVRARSKRYDASPSRMPYPLRQRHPPTRVA